MGDREEISPNDSLNDFSYIVVIYGGRQAEGDKNPFL